jgi:hypothetical protein
MTKFREHASVERLDAPAIRSVDRDLKRPAPQSLDFPGC